MALAKADLLIDQGTTWAAAWIYQTDNGAGPVPVDLTGWKARAQVRRGYGGDLLASWHSDPAVTRDGPITLGTDGKVTLSLPASASLTWTWWKHGPSVWDLELVKPDGTVIRFVEGTATLRPGVTDSE